MIQKLSGILTRKCPHEHTLVVRSVGVTRSVCEKCGHLSFSIQASIGHHFNIDEFLEEDLPQAAGI